MMKEIADFEAFILPYAPYTPAEIIQHAIREAIADFMRESKIAVDVLELETQDRVPDYMLDIPDCRRFLGVKTIERSRKHDCGRRFWEPMISGEYGHYEIQLRKGNAPMIKLTDVHARPQIIRMEYYWAIGRDDCEVPDFIYEDFMDVITAGTLMRLAKMPEHDHLLRSYNENKATWFDGVQRAKIEKSGGKPKFIIGSPILKHRGNLRLWR